MTGQKNIISRKILALGGLAIALVATLGCTGKSTNSLSNKELKVGIAQEFETLNPVIMTMSASSYIYAMLGRSLAVLDASGKWVPQLAVEIPSLENKQAKFSSDRKKIVATWKIRPEAKWGDGTPVTCADYAFTLEVGKNPTVSVGEKEVYDQIDSIVADPKDPKVCTITYGKPRWDFNKMGNFRALPAHLERPVYEKFKGEKEGYEKNTLYTTDPSNPGLYNGPYMLTEWKLGSHVALIRNPHFYGPQAKIERILVKVIANNNTLEANLVSGTIDMIASLGFSFDQALAFEKTVAAKKLPYVVSFRPSLTYEHIDLNLENPILKDVRVRQALLLALNRQELVDALFEGKQAVAHHNIAPIDPWFTLDASKVKLYPHNPAEAEKLLEAAGWKLGADGIREKGKQRLSLSIMTTAGNKTRETVQTFLQNQWKTVGIELTIKNEPPRVFFGETIRKRSYPALAMYAWVSAPEQVPRSNLHTGSIPNEKNGWSGQNTMSYSNPKVDKLIEQLELEFDPAKRVSIAQQILRFYTEELPVLPLYFRSDNGVVPDRLRGWELTGHMYADSNQVENWEIQ